MAIDPHAPPESLADSGSPAIENELPTYRAVSPMAVASLGFGIASALCFADISFLIAAALAVVSGVLALAKLRKYGDVLTGANLAKAGIALAVAFSLASLTILGVQSAFRYKGASEFAADYSKRLNSGKTGDLLWYRLPPFQRRGVSPGEFESQIRKSKEPNQYQEFVGQIDRITTLIAGPPKRTIKFDRIENTHLDKTTNEASLIYRIEGPDEAGGEKVNGNLILVEIKAEDSPQKGNWFVSSIVYPFTPQGYNPRAKEEAEEKAHGHIH